jgi:hypothetical protein
VTFSDHCDDRAGVNALGDLSFSCNPLSLEFNQTFNDDCGCGATPSSVTYVVTEA